MPYPWSAHDVLTASDLNAAIATGIMSTGLGAWTAYTPAWSGTLGNGSLTGAYCKIGRLVHFRISLTWGTTTTHGASSQTLTLPPFAANFSGWLGGARIIDASAAQQFYRHVFANSSTVLAMSAEAAATFVSNTVPMTWATTDSLNLQGSYESTT